MALSKDCAEEFLDALEDGKDESSFSATDESLNDSVLSSGGGEFDPIPLSTLNLIARALSGDHLVIEDESDHDDLEDECGHDGMRNVEVSPSAAGADFVPPDKETTVTLARLVDELFSDENIAKESYITKHIRRNKQGYVSLKVVNSLRKVKRVTRDYRAIAYATRLHSTLLELNDNETKVRRRDALTKPLPPPPAGKVAGKQDGVAAEFRTVIVLNLPQDKAQSVAGVSELFADCGRITQVRLIQPGSSSAGALSKLLVKHIAVSSSSSCSALVEFERLADALKACRSKTNTTDWRHGMHVTPLARVSKQDREAEGEDMGKKPQKKKKNTRVTELSRGEFHSSTGSLCSSSGSDNEGKSRRGTRSPAGRQQKLRTCSDHLKAGGRGEGGKHDSDSEDWRARTGSFGSEVMGSKGGSPWVLRRKQLQKDDGLSSSLGALNTGAAEDLAKGRDLGGSERVLRQPRGPDGSSGFKIQRQVKSPLS